MIFLYSKPKLLFSFKWYNIQNQFIGFSKNFSFLVNISGNFILVKFGDIPKLIESSKFLKYKVDTRRNLRLIDPSRFPRF